MATAKDILSGEWLPPELCPTRGGGVVLSNGVLEQMLRDIGAEYHEDAVASLRTDLIAAGCRASSSPSGVLVPAAMTPDRWPLLAAVHLYVHWVAFDPGARGVERAFASGRNFIIKRVYNHPSRFGQMVAEVLSPYPYQAKYPDPEAKTLDLPVDTGGVLRYLSRRPGGLGPGLSLERFAAIWKWAPASPGFHDTAEGRLSDVRHLWDPELLGQEAANW